MRPKALYSKLKIDAISGDVEVLRSVVLTKLLRLLSIPVLLLCSLMCYLCITELESIFKYISIPTAILLAGYYMFGFAGVGNPCPEVILELSSGKLTSVMVKIDRAGVGYAQVIEKSSIKLSDITAIQDESVCIGNPGSPGYNSSWKHEILIYYKYCNMTSTCSLVDLGLSHDDHLKLYEHLNNLIK